MRWRIAGTLVVLAMIAAFGAPSALVKAPGGGGSKTGGSDVRSKSFQFTATDLTN